MKKFKLLYLLYAIIALVISAFLGKEEVLNRLDSGLTHIQKLRDEASH